MSSEQPGLQDFSEESKATRVYRELRRRIRELGAPAGRTATQRGNSLGIGRFARPGQ